MQNIQACFKLLLPWIILFILIILDKFHERDNDKYTAKIEFQLQPQYLYVLRSFQSIKPYIVNGTWQCGTYTMVNILDSDFSSILKKQLEIKCESPKLSWINEPIWKNVTIVPMLRQGLCRMHTFGFFCPSAEINSQQANETQKQQKCNITAIDGKTTFLLGDKNQFEVSSLASDGVPRKLVYCVGRRFFFQSWHLLITYLELARLQEVDMVVLYLLSIQSAVYELAKLYELNGFLRLRSSLKMPTDIFKEMGFNPNMETEWNNEAIEYNDCMYEHRDHTNFIAFTTMDDIIISSPTNFRPLAPIFTNLSNAYPDSAEFVLRVHNSRIKSLTDITDSIYSNSTGDTGDQLFRAIEEFWKYGIYLHTPIVDPKPNTPTYYVKTVIIPERVQTIWLHHALSVEPGGINTIVPYTSAFVMHLRFELEAGYNITYPRIKDIDTVNAFLYSPLTNATERMVQTFRMLLDRKQNINNKSAEQQNIEKWINLKENITDLIKGLPRTESFLNEFRKYNNDFDKLMRNLLADNSTAEHRCSNYLHHRKLNTIVDGCVNAQNKWTWKTFSNIVEIDHISSSIITNVAMLNQRLFELAQQCADF